MAISYLKSVYERHQKWVPIAAFLAGFVFDMLVLKRIDEPQVIVQQALYIIVSGFLIAIELVEHVQEISLSGFIKKIWPYREALLHFLLGTLLNSYAIFYFKSASAITSMIFIVLLVALLIVNEFKRFGKSQTQVHVAFLSLCLISYFVSLSPILFGFIGKIPFVIAMIASFFVFSFYIFILKSKLRPKPQLLKTHVIYPFAAIQILFVILYFAHAIPPVPLSVKYMGIFHGAEKTEDGYALTYTRPQWKFWQHGDQTFFSQPGDVIYCYTQIFSPARFKDELQVRWFYHDPKQGWTTSDAIALAVVGGREEGYRAVTQKANFIPGDWKVAVETRDGQEVGNIGFTVVNDDSERGSHVIYK